MKRVRKILNTGIIGLIILFIPVPSLTALDFSILNRGKTIFQEILIETDQEETNYYYNFGLTGLEPGARHNIHISTTEDLIFCSFYLFGIANENYVIENVAIEEHSVVYILPEHYQEEMDIYNDMDNPDAVYGADFFERTEYAFVDEESPENQFKTEVELFNYTNYRIFRIYCHPVSDFTETGMDPPGDSPGETPFSPEEEINLLEGRVLGPQESLTLELVMDPDVEYEVVLKSADNLEFKKALDGSSDSDFLVFYDSDRVKDWENKSLVFKNSTTEELKEIYIMDQESGNRVEVLDGKILRSQEEIQYLLTADITKADLIIKTASNSKIYIFDWDFSHNPRVEIQDE